MINERLIDINMNSAPVKKEDQLRMYGFAVHKREMISAGQMKACETIFDFHGDSVLSLVAVPKGTKTVFSIVCLFSTYHL